jgi:hypothetical protein
LTVPSQYWQEVSIQIEAPIAESYEILESWGFITKRKKQPHTKWFCVRPWRSSCCSMVSQGEYRTSGIFVHGLTIIRKWRLLWTTTYSGPSFIHSARSTSQSSSQIIKEYRKNLIITHDGKQRSQHLGKNLLLIVQSIPIIDRSPVYKNEKGQVAKGRQFRNSCHRDTINSVFFHKFDIIHHQYRVCLTSSRGANWAMNFYNEESI